ncbi:hypothetical protein PRZ48_005927 [Zasmidium cellare]|uniref:Uncharacterized protein n=1 Tax=Zasmidium cellare TaxID=395010 RepID=A0ABR0ELP8_ZASCE|nr:hypothetical protein PRZ48_005927 [Zasmidium cellare]
MEQGAETASKREKIEDDAVSLHARGGMEEGNGEIRTAEEDTKQAAAAPPPGPVTDHGLVTWLQVLAAFGMWTNSWGIVNSFGVFQTYYQVAHLSHKSPSQIAWIGSMQGFLLIVAGMLSGPLHDAGHFRLMSLVGSLLVVFGLMMTSLCTEYWQTFLAQSIVVGIGSGLVLIPSAALIPQYFVKRRAVATSLASGGSGFEIEPRAGFGWAVRAIAFIALFFAVLSMVLARNRIPPRKPRKLFDVGFFKETSLILLSIGGLFAFMGLYIPTGYIGVYAIDLKIAGASTAFYLTAVAQAGNFAGRLVVTPFADKIGPVNICVMSSLSAGILSFCWIAIKNVAGLVVFGVLFGSCLGLILGMAAAGYATLMRADISKYGAYLACGFFTVSPGILIGNPISGAILGADHSFVGLQAFSGAVLLVGACFIFAARWAAVGWAMKSI